MIPSLNPNSSAAPTVVWPGLSGARYTFNLHAIGTVYLAISGVYISCKGGTLNSWHAIYVGETDNLLRRLTNELASHHCWQCAKRHGATHICTLRVDGGETERLRIETDLRHGLNSPCNQQ